MLTRLFFWLILLAVIAAIPAYLKRAEIALAVMERGSLSRMLEQPLADLGDGLHVALCGAGGPLPDRNRSGPCVAVAAGKRLFIVDAGTNGVRNLGLMNYPIGDIEAVFLTHYHSDHLDGLGEMATLRWVQGNHKSPLKVYGTAGIADIVSGFNQVYARDAIFRNQHHGDRIAPLSGHGMVAKQFATPLGGKGVRVYDKDGIQIDSFAVDHAPVDAAVGYRFSYKGRTVVISGDTSRSLNVEKFSRNADLLVHSAMSPELVGIINRSAMITNNNTIEKISRDILEYHSSPLDAAETARDAGVKHLLFYHVVPSLPLPGMEAAWLDGVSVIFPHYTLGRDGTVISLPAISGEVKIVSRGFRPAF